MVDINDLDDNTLEKIQEMDEVQKAVTFDEHDLDEVSETLRDFVESDGFEPFTADVKERSNTRLKQESVANVIESVCDEIDEAYE